MKERKQTNNGHPLVFSWTNLYLRNGSIMPRDLRPDATICMQFKYKPLAHGKNYIVPGWWLIWK